MEDKLNKKLCKGCTKCCEYINIKLDTPESEEDFDNILWYLLHENVYVWVKRPNKWYVRVNTKCKPLTKGLCKEYSKRPMLCREYSQKVCEHHKKTRDEKYAFHTRKEFISYLKKHKKQFYGFYE